MNKAMMKRAWAQGFADATDGKDFENPYEDYILFSEYLYGFQCGRIEFNEKETV